VIRVALEAVAIAALAYFAALNAIYLVFTIIAWRGLTSHRRQRLYAAVDEAFASPLTPGISVVLPAYNEAAGIIDSVRSLLALRYPAHEVVVVNDGSRDATLERLQTAFDLVPIRKALRDELTTAPVRGVFASRGERALIVVDKENGGKADALNCGLNASRHEYICAVDADAMLEEDALIRVAQPVLDDPELVAATGGIVRIANGCTVDHGRVVDVALPRSSLARLQVVEYFRAFLVGRMGWSRLDALLIVSGAFGLFNRELVEEVGGWSSRTVGEDIELVISLHDYLRRRGERYRIDFVPDPVCWTECPEDLRALSSQRRRWQRGLGESLWRHRRMTANPKYGFLGLVAIPYFIVFEFVGPLMQVLGYPIVLAAFLTGAVSLAFVGAFLALAVLLGILLSVSALGLEELSFRRYTRAREAATLFVYAVLENFGYRQLNDFWKLQAFADLLRRKGEWGEMRRRGLGLQSPPS
jgi:cellulose synthase/poly-beta-1,6-N-acetylglucosamine synthase-like glycosyltransferase